MLFHLLLLVSHECILEFSRDLIIYNIPQIECESRNESSFKQNTNRFTKMIKRMPLFTKHLFLFCFLGVKYVIYINM